MSCTRLIAGPSDKYAQNIRLGHSVDIGYFSLQNETV